MKAQKQQNHKRYALMLLYIMIIDILPLSQTKANIIIPKKIENVISNRNDYTNMSFTGYLPFAPYKDSFTKNQSLNERKFHKSKVFRIRPSNSIRLAGPDKPEGGGPSTPEVQGFTPASYDKMVDPFTGSFTYNIPLFDVGGYPINIAYNSNVLANDEASWVGLGWNLNVGTVTRSLRGLPDDFKGDIITKRMHFKDRFNTFIGLGADIQIAGLNSIAAATMGMNMVVDYDNYAGWGVTLGTKGGFRVGNDKTGGSLSMSSSQGISSRSGGYFSPGLSLSANLSNGDYKASLGYSLGASINSREGLKDVTYGISYKGKVKSGLDKINADKTDYSVGSASSSFSLNSAMPAMTPNIEFPTSSLSTNFHATVGGELTVVHPSVDISGGSTTEKLTTDSLSEAAYGYMYLQHSGDGSLMDMNRENDGPYYTELPSLPVPVLTFDEFNVSAHGTGGSFRPFRGDLGMIHDSYQHSSNMTVGAGGEIGLGNLIHGGVDGSGGDGGNTSGLWMQDNLLYNKLKFADSAFLANNPNFEQVYFKNIGEQTILENDKLFLDTLKSFNPISIGVHKTNEYNTGTLSPIIGNSTVDHSLFRNSKREPRKTLFSWKTFADQKLINKIRHPGIIYEDTENPTFKKDHHIAEINITESNGSRYIFGLPAYNYLQEDVSFSVDEDASISQRTYNFTSPNPDNSVKNEKGKDNYFHKLVTPAYAYSWMLTEVLSEDYIDINNDGPSPEDFGNYTFIKYSHLGNVKWRTPNSEEGRATNQLGALHTPDDNKASYSYGEKEIYYPSSIESKTHIAKFYTSRREDGLNVKGRNGGFNDAQYSTPYKLDSIKVFTMDGLNQNEPIKSIHFQYDYSLHKGQSDSRRNQGKLTLKKLWFQFLDSKKSTNHPYSFIYNNNPNFNIDNVDRWGGYKENNPSYPENRNFPYVVQTDFNKQDQFSSAWLLNKIHTPAASTINIDYEAHRYSYVQDKDAMSLYKIAGFSSTDSGDFNDSINPSNNYMIIDPGIQNISNDQLEHLFKKIDYYYFKTRMQIASDSSIPFEIIEGFDKLNPNYGVRPDGKIWLKVDLKGDYHPFAKAGFEVIRSQFPHRLYTPNVQGVQNGNFMAAVDAFIEAAGSVLTLRDENQVLNSQSGVCEKINPFYSFIRLNALNGVKIAGGARVKKLTIDDNWGKMQVSGNKPELNFQYGAEYSYILENGQCSGVASNEPFVGNDENALVKPLFFSLERPMAASISKNMLEPYGQLYYPSAQIGYSRMVETPINHQYDDGKSSPKVGDKVYEFYTAKDFPTKSKKSDIQNILTGIQIPTQIYNKLTKAATISQSYYIEINNMHGRSKKTSLRDAEQNEIESEEYIYNLTADGSLNNVVKVVDPVSGKINERNIGLNYDFIIDPRHFKTEIKILEVQVNISTFFLGPFPAVIPIPIPSFTENLSELKSVVTTKSVMRTGILKSKMFKKRGLKEFEEYVAYDGNTGEPVVIKYPNEFNQNIFKVQIPAYWVFNGMGPAYQNDKARLFNTNITNGNASTSNKAKIQEGDELMVMDCPSGYRNVWVAKSNDESISLIGRDGHLVNNGNYSFMVKQSGYKNNLSSIFASFNTLEDPVTNQTKLSLGNANDKINSVNIQLYSDYWQTEQLLKIKETLAPCKCDPPILDTMDLRSAIDNALSSYRQTGGTFPPYLSFDISTRIPVMVNGTYSYVNYEVKQCSYTMIPIDGLQVMPFEFGKLPQININWDKECNSTSYVIVTIGFYRFLLFSTNCILRTCGTPDAVVGYECNPAVINPFIHGILGRYKPSTSYLPKDLLTNDGTTKNSGFLSAFVPFASWQSDGLKINIDPGYYQRSDSVICIDSYGNPREVQNALNIPSGSIYGFRHMINTASASYAGYADIAYDGMEDYNYLLRRSSGGICQDRNFDNSLLVATTEYSHSGRYSLPFSSIGAIEYDFEVKNVNTNRPDKQTRLSTLPVIVHEYDQLQKFKPKPGQYLVSAWVRVRDINSKEYDNIRMNIGGQVFTPSGPIIDGWQEIKGIISLNLGAQKLKFYHALSGISGIINTPRTGIELWLDDVRIHPIKSSMESYAYDGKFLRLDANLNQENYATFYEYNYEGNLSRVKKETEKGIVTLKEVVTELPKSN